MNDNTRRLIISPLDRAEHEQELGYLAAGLPASAKSTDAAKWAIDQIDRLRGALGKIQRYGHGKGHGCGYTCATMAKDALENTSLHQRETRP